VSVRRGDLRIEIEPIAMFEAYASLMDGLDARAAAQRQAGELRKTTKRARSPPTKASAERFRARRFSRDFTSH